MVWLNVRRRRLEIMDQPDLDATRHIHALQSLARINYLSDSASILWPELAAEARAVAPQALRILDIATGAGDLPIRLWQRSRKTGLDFHLEGCDISPVAVEHARSRAERAGAPVRFFEQDALSSPTLSGYDAVMCSLFLHHLDEAQAMSLLRRMAETASRLVLVSDLQRGWTAWALTHLFTRLLTTSPVVHVDGPRSIEAAFTRIEAQGLAERAGLSGAKVCRRWPLRWLLSWRRLA